MSAVLIRATGEILKIWKSELIFDYPSHLRTTDPFLGPRVEGSTPLRMFALRGHVHMPKII